MKFECMTSALSDRCDGPPTARATHSEQFNLNMSLFVSLFLLNPEFFAVAENCNTTAPHLVSVIWKILYPAIKEASRVRDCLPEPPTPTRRAFPQGVRIIREI